MPAPVHAEIQERFVGYFSNGTEGMMYEEEWCNKCLHREGCPIWMAHMIHNYDECNNKESILHMLIPIEDNGVGNKKCAMFVDRGLLSNLALQQFESSQS